MLLLCTYLTRTWACVLETCSRICDVMVMKLIPCTSYTISSQIYLTISFLPNLSLGNSAVERN